MIILIKSNSYPQGYIIKKEADTLTYWKSS